MIHTAMVCTFVFARKASVRIDKGFFDLKIGMHAILNICLRKLGFDIQF